MKIAHISTGYPIRFHGGITNYVRTLAEMQSKAGHDLTVYAGPASGDRSELPFDVVEYRSRRLRPFSLRILERDPEARRLADELSRERFDIVHFHMGLDLALEFYDRVAFGQVPYVVSIHDYYLVCPRITMVDYRGEVSRSVDLVKCSSCIGVLDQIDLLEKTRRQIGVTLPRIPSDRIYRRSETMRRFLRNSARALPVSTRVREIVSAVEPQARYQVMHIGNSSATVSAHEKAPSDRLRVTVLGVLSHHKGAGVIGKLLRHIDRSRVDVHFFGRSDRKTLKTLTARGLIDHGAYKPSDLPEIMRHSDIGLVCPIWEDNAPQVVMEFLNYGVPVLGARMGGIPDFVSDHNGMLFDPHSDPEVMRAARWLNALEQSDLDRLRPSGKLKTPQAHADEMLALYREIVNERR